jgi:hypothetical protein
MTNWTVRFLLDCQDSIRAAFRVVRNFYESEHESVSNPNPDSPRLVPYTVSEPNVKCAAGRLEKNEDLNAVYGMGDAKK